MNSLLLQTPAQLTPHLRALRKQRGLTQSAVASRLGIKQSRYAIIESKPESVSTGQLLDVLAVLGVDVLLRPREVAAVAEPPRDGEDW